MARPVAGAQPSGQKLLHVCHAQQDTAWVAGVLIPALGLHAGQYCTRAEYDVGTPRLEEVERAVTACRYTLLIASAAATVDTWVQFATSLAQYLGIEEGLPRLLVLIHAFDPESTRARELLPLRQRALVCVDCRDRAHEATAFASIARLLHLAAAEAPLFPCPYPGLRSFGRGAANDEFGPDVFFGRDEVGRRIVDHLRREGRVLLVGPSGCGKSSLAYAGVLPVLRAEVPGLKVALVRPGPDPDLALRRELAAQDARFAASVDAWLEAAEPRAAPPTIDADDTPILVLIDQFEEVFARDEGDDRDRRSAFFDRLAVIGRVEGLAILLCMRADFYGDLMSSRAWAAFEQHRVELTPLRGDALALAISRPAERAGVHVEEALVERLVGEAEDERASEALPLIQVALVRLWAKRRWRYLSLADYDELAEGERGLDLILAKHADASIAGLSESSRVLARRVVVELVHLGDGRPDTRRRRRERELRCDGDVPADIAAVIGHLAARRLLVTGAELSPDDDPGERHVDLAHDALITGWPALAGWVAERRTEIVTRRRLEARTAGGGLLAASELPEFTRWLAYAATPAGRAIGASREMVQLTARSLAHVAASRRRRRRLVAVIIGGLVAAVAVISIAAVAARRNARRAAESAAVAAQEALANRRQTARTEVALAHALLSGEHGVQALPYLVAAREHGLDDVPLRTLFRWAAAEVPLQVIDHRAIVEDLAWSPDGRRVATAGHDGMVRIWDAGTGQSSSPPLIHGDVVTAVVWSPDATRVVSVSSAQSAVVWDVATGAAITRAIAHDGLIVRIAWDPDGTRLATASEDGSAGIWDARTGRLLAGPLRHGHTVTSLAWSPDGRRLATASYDDTAAIWDARTGRALTRPLGLGTASAITLRWSADGTLLATGGDETGARVWNTRTGARVSSTVMADPDVTFAAWSPDGTRLRPRPAARSGCGACRPAPHRRGSSTGGPSPRWRGAPMASTSPRPA